MVRKRLERNNEADLFAELWLKYFPYWPIILLLVVLSVGSAWGYLRYQIPVYESSATILLKDEKKGLDESKMIESLNQLSTKKIIENEIEVIKSRTLMAEVAKNLHLYAPVFEEGKVVTRSAYAISPIKIIAQSPDSLIETEKVYFQFDENEKKVIIGRDHLPLDKWITTKFGIIKFILNEKYSGRTVDGTLYFSLLNSKGIANGLVNSLTVTAVNKLSTLLNLTIQDEVPERGEDILNELIVSYNKAAINDKNELAANTLAFVEDRLRFVAKDLDSIERQLQQYKANKGAIDISSQSRLFLENVSSNDQKLSDINMQLSVLDQVEAYVLSKNNSGGIVPSTLGVANPVLTQLLDRLYTVELEYEKLRKTTAEKNPAVVAVTDQINKIKPGILENIQNQRRGLEASRKNLYSTNNAYSSMLYSLPQKERDLVEINREQIIKSNIYTFLLQKREETALSYSSAVADSRVVDKAQSSSNPISPNGRKIYMIAVVFGFASGIGLISLKELLNRKVTSRKEIDNYISFPVIAELIYEKSKEPLVIKSGRNSFSGEQFRKLRASISMMGLKQENKKILITSSISQEGKSFVAANLGHSLALGGKRVILIELDLINPSLSSKLSVHEERGISNYLLEECNAEDIIKQTDIHNNLFIIPSGPLPENPSELIMNGRVEELMDLLSRQFDYIIVDTAPVCALSDAYILSPLCDLTLYVVRHNHTPKVLIQKFEENNDSNELNNVAIIFNGIRNRGFSKNIYDLGYGYGYIYNQKINKQKRLIDSRVDQ